VHKYLCLLGSVVSLSLLIFTLGCGNNNNGGNGTTGQNITQILAIAPVAQQEPEWCWLASGQMVFQYFQVPSVNATSYQCGIIAAFYGPNSACFYDCSVCDVGAGSSSNVTMMLEDYSYLATNFTEVLYSQFTPSELPFQQVQSDINSQTPILAGINAGSTTVLFAQSQHLVVIVGYEVQSGQDYLVVNDPFPYAAVGYPDPYLGAGAQMLQAGQYLVSYNTFIQSLQWNTSFDQLTMGAPDASDLQRLERLFGDKGARNWQRKLDEHTLIGPGQPAVEP
jgi:hypothetical protein